MFKPRHKRFIIAPWVESVGLAHLLRWNYYANGDNDLFYVYVNGVLTAATKEQQVILPNLRGSVKIDIIPVTRLDRNASYTTYIYIPPTGDRIKITIPVVDLDTNPDFYAYRLYWSSDGSDPSVLMAENVGANNNTFITSLLEDAITYKFCASLVDHLGNESDKGAIISATVNTVPQQATTSITYDHNTRKATIEADQPGGQDADVVAYNIYANYIPGLGLQPDVIDQPVYIGISGASYVTPILYPGNWRWDVRAVDATGLESTSNPLSLTIAASGQAPTAPSPPFYMDAISVASGAIQITAKMTGATDLNIYLNGTLYDTTSADDTTSYTTGALDEDTYSVTVSALNDGSESDQTQPVSVTTDSTAPSGTLTLIAELV